MKRVIIATILLVVAIEMLIIAPLLWFTPTGKHVLTAISPPPTPTPVPVLTAEGTPPTVSATAAYLMDADSGHQLMSKNAQERLPMASTTKIMTALIAIQTANLNQMVTIKQDAVNEAIKNDGSNAQLVAGDQMRLKDLLYGLLLPSGDDAAIAIADAVSGSPARFVVLMNTYAQRLHLNQTHYIDPDGLTYYAADGKPEPGHYTSAADLAHLARIALQNPLFAQIVELQTYVLPASATHHAYVWTNTDDLLSNYAGAIGVKTGYTVEAGYCLVFAATSDGHHLIGVLLHDESSVQRFADAETMLSWGFALPLRPPTASS